MIRATAMQRSLYTIPTQWLVVTDKDSVEQTREAVQRFMALHDTQIQLRELNARRERLPLDPAGARVLGELLGVGRMALFARPLRSDLLDTPSSPTDRLLAVAVSVGIRHEIEEHLRLPLDFGHGGVL